MLSPARPSTTRWAALGWPLFLGPALAVVLIVIVSSAAPAAQAGLQFTSSAEEIVVSTTIQAALDAAAPGDTVFVPAGKYTESLSLSLAVSLTGPSPYSATIYAPADQRVLSVSGATIDRSVVISGLSFQGARNAPSGGGINLADGATPLLLNLVISDNQVAGTGGGLYSSSPVFLDHVSFISNTAWSGGGAAVGTAGSVIENSLFRGNVTTGVFPPGSGSGGGLAASGPVTLVNVSFISNVGFKHGGGAYIYCCANLFAYPTSSITGGVFEDNESLGYGGGLYLDQGSLTLTGTSFIDNVSAGSGGGAYLAYLGEAATVTNGLFQGNQCLQSTCNGGGLGANALVIASTQFVSNTSAGKGGGIYTEGNLGVRDSQFIANLGNGGGLYHVLGALEVVNSLFAANHGYAQYLDRSDALILHTTFAGPDTWSASAVFAEQSTVGITNTIISNYPTGILESKVFVSIVYQDYNLFFNVGAPASGTVTTGGHSRAGNPNFVNLAAHDYHLGIGSAALDTGITSAVMVDFEGDSRPFGRFVDIGFDEALIPLLYTFLPQVMR